MQLGNSLFTVTTWPVDYLFLFLCVYPNFQNRRNTLFIAERHSSLLGQVTVVHRPPRAIMINCGGPFANVPDQPQKINYEVPPSQSRPVRAQNTISHHSLRQYSEVVWRMCHGNLQGFVLLKPCALNIFWLAFIYSKCLVQAKVVHPNDLAEIQTVKAQCGPVASSHKSELPDTGKRPR